MSSSLSISRRLTEKVEGGMRLKSNFEGLSDRDCLGQWLVNVGAIDSSSSDSVQAGASGVAVVVEADVGFVGWT
jgi:hypothetical protein